MNWYRNIKIAQKMGVLAGVLLAGLVFIAMVYLYGAVQREDATKVQLNVESMQLALANISEGILQARRREKDFLLRDDLNYVDKHAKAMTVMDDAIDSMDRLAETPSQKKLARDLQAASNDYEKAFADLVARKVALGLTEKEGILGALRISVHDVEEQLKPLNRDDLTVSMLMMRRHEKDFIARKTEKYIQRMADRKAEFLDMLANSRFPESTRLSIREGVTLI